MADTVRSMIRTLQRFFEYDMMGHIRLEQSEIFMPLGSADTIGARFSLRGRDYEIIMEGPEVNSAYNCGSVFLNDRRYGPIDERTWTAIALDIKKQIAKAVA